MAKVKYNHKARVLSFQPAKIKSLYPGTIVQFKYTGKDIFDKLPMVLVLWNDYVGYKIHGVNLNYLGEYQIKLLFEKLMSKKAPLTKSSTKGNILTEEDQLEEYDDNLPYRNLLKDPYTRLKLPTYKEDRSGNPLSKSEAIKQMDTLYEKKLKRIVKKEDIYRSYHQKKMSSIKVVTYDIEGLIG